MNSGVKLGGRKIFYPKLNKWFHARKTYLVMFQRISTCLENMVSLT